MKSALDELIMLVPPRRGPRSDVDWPGVESVLGFRLPADYKTVIETYGPGQFDHFITLYQPVTPFLTIELAHQAKRANEILARLRAGGREHIPFAEGEIVPVAGTDNGDTVYWVLEDPRDPDSWTITAGAARNTHWPRFPGGIVDFLCAVLSRRTRLIIFPDNFPSDEPRFQPDGWPDPARIARLRSQGLYRDL
jgi:hypothetical protein